ncbi:MAG: hypothetical protein HQM01_01060 [Magnetococcales bacterium]|nr:hypothetical protein [Magnetococcales bacterium]
MAGTFLDMLTIGFEHEIVLLVVKFWSVRARIQKIVASSEFNPTSARQQDMAFVKPDDTMAGDRKRVATEVLTKAILSPLQKAIFGKKRALQLVDFAKPCPP